MIFGGWSFKEREFKKIEETGRYSPRFLFGEEKKFNTEGIEAVRFECRGDGEVGRKWLRPLIAFGFANGSHG